MGEKKLNFFSIAIMYVGAIMGAGFASGREGWQFFGIFGYKATLGIGFATIMFALLGIMISYIATKKSTSDMGEIVSPIESTAVSQLIGYTMSAMLYTVIIAMSSAGGAFLNQQFGWHKAVGGIIIVILVIATVLGDFERISKVFRMVIPLLFVLDVVFAFMVIFSDIEQSGQTEDFAVSTLSPNWYVSAVVFISYNLIGVVPILGEAARKGKTQKGSLVGAGLGGLMLGVLTIILILALQKDMAYTNSLDLPMLGYSNRLGRAANLIFGMILFFAIYSAATSTYYGFTTKLPRNKYKKWIIVFGAIAGFFIGLTGFKNVVSYIYPIEGYIGFVLILLIITNFFITLRKEGKK